MKKLLDFVPVDIIPYHKGLIFIQKINIENSGTKLRILGCNFETREINTLTKSAYFMNKFGEAYKEISEQLADPIGCSAAHLSGKKTAVVYDNGETGIFDRTGKLIWTGDLLYDGAPVNSAAAEGSSFWCVARKRNSVLKYSVSSKRFAFRLGSKDSLAFLVPYHVSKYGNELFVSCPGLNAIKTINLKTFEVDEYCRFKEPVFKYLQFKNFEIVVLSSGVYVL